MKKLMLLAFAGAALLFAGCSALQYGGTDTLNGQKLASVGTSVGHITTFNSGFYLLWIPIFTGSETEPGAIVFNKDTVNLQTAVRMVTAQSKKMNASTTDDLVSMTGSTMVPFPIPYLFYWKTVNVSGNAIR